MENGRMTSIAVAVVKQHPSVLPVVETGHVALIVASFIESNDLEKVVSKIVVYDIRLLLQSQSICSKEEEIHVIQLIVPPLRSWSAT